jgi:hypothetical protein
LFAAVAKRMLVAKNTQPIRSIDDREPLITFAAFGKLTKWAEIRYWAPIAARN